MNIETQNPVMVFKKEHNGYVFYSVGLSKKNQDGSYTNGYMPCQFKNGVELANQTKIYIKKAWLTFYLKDIANSDKKQTMPYIFISEYSTIDQTIDKAKEEVKEEQSTTVFMEDVELDLPF